MRQGKEITETNAKASETDENKYDIKAFILRTPYGNLAGKYTFVDNTKSLFND